MSILDSDSPLLSARFLSGIHEDAVRCIYDERLNRLKRLPISPSEQLTEFRKVADDALKFWEATKALPEDFQGRRKKLFNKLGVFFDRASRYANYHADQELLEPEKALKRGLLKKIANNRELITL